MKITRQIKIIGILCLISSGFGLLEALAGFDLSSSADKFGNQLSELNIIHSGIIPYAIGIVVNSLYFIGGIFFLLKKRFSLKLIYGVISLSIIYLFLDWIVPYIFNLYVNSSIGLPHIRLGMFLDMALLFSVYRISGAYSMLLNGSIIQIRGKGINLRRTKTITLLGFALVLVPLSIFVLWLYAASTGVTHEEKSMLFYSFLPDFIPHKFTNYSYISFWSSVGSIILSGIGSKTNNRLWKTVNIIVLTLSIILLLLALFTLL